MRGLFWIFGILFLLPNFITGQILLDQKMGVKNVLEEKALFYATDRDLSFEEVRRMDTFMPLEKMEDIQQQDQLWVKFSAQIIDSLSNIYFFRSSTPHFTIYQKIASSDWKEIQAGSLTPLNKRSLKEEYPWMIRIKVDPDGMNEFYVKLEKSRYSNNGFSLAIGDELTFYHYYYRYKEYTQPTEIFAVIYVSGLTMIFIFILMMYLLVRETVYFYYLLYLFFQIIYSLISYSHHPLRWINLSRYYPSLNFTINEAVQFIFIGFYILFIYKLLEINKSDFLGKTILGLAVFSFGYALYSLLYLGLNYTPKHFSTLFIISRSIALPVNFILIVWILFKIRHPLIFYFIIAHLFFFFGAMVSVWAFLTEQNNNPESLFFFKNSPDIIFQAGLLGEVICFSLALAFRVRLIQNEKRQSIRAYIHQLQANKDIQEKMNKELDLMVHKKTDELIQVYSEMERRRDRELKLEFEQKLNKLENIALHSQMNPHFLFNSMNAIKHLIVTGATQKASLYLDDFSILLRGVLQNSKRETISVEEELRMLKLYLTMEKARLGKSFEFEIENDDLPELEMYHTPVLILQPIVENAIWHGLQPSVKQEKKLKVSFKMQEELVIEIKDNGIGREASQKNKEINAPIHESMGIRIVQDRLALYNHSRELKIYLKIEDLKENGYASGTLVTFIYSNGMV